MNSKILSVSAAMLLGIVGNVLPAHAMPDYIQQEIDRTNVLIKEANEYLEKVIYPQAEAQRAYEQQLYNSCQAGYTNACAELQRIEQRRLQWMIQNDCKYRTGLNSCSK